MLKRCLPMVFVFWPCLALAQEDPAKACVNRPTVTFDHAAKPDLLSAALQLSDKETFLIRVINTEPENFTYSVTGAVAIPRERQPLVKENVTIHEECVTHAKQFGGYLMRVERKQKANTELPNKIFMVSVETDSWNYEVSGGFSLTTHSDPIYALVPVSEGQFRVVEDDGDDKGADARPGVVSIVTVFHSSRPRIGISFGLGINEGAGATYYFGPTWRLGNVAGITGGFALGPETRLPDGVNVNDTVTDVNLLKTRQTRPAGAFFFCISYSFLGSLDTLKKPFAGQ